MKTKGLGHLLAGNIIFRSLNILCTVTTTFLLTRLLGTSGYGILSLLIANTAIFNLLTCLGAESGITYHYAAGSQNKPVIFSITYAVVLFQTILLVLAECIYYLINGHFSLEGMGNGTLGWIILYFVSIIVIDKYQALFNGAHLYTNASRLVFIISMLSMLVFGYCYFFHQAAGASFYLNIFILSSVAQAILLVVFFHRNASRKLSFTKLLSADWKLFFSYSFLVLITNLVQFLAYRIDYWFVDYFHGKDQLGLYSLAVKLGQVLWILPVLMAGIFFPRMAAEGAEKEEQAWLRLIRLSGAFFFAAALLAALLAAWIIPLFAGELFRASVMPFLYLLPGLLIFCYNIIFAAYFAGRKMLSINFRGSLLCLVLVLAGDLLLIPALGMNGAAIASSIAYTAAGLHHLWQFSRIRQIPVSSLLIVRRADMEAVSDYIRKYIRRA
jgi:O-antigen/teichoic acid export membrane protein